MVCLAKSAAVVIRSTWLHMSIRHAWPTFAVSKEHVCTSMGDIIFMYNYACSSDEGIVLFVRVLTQ